MRTLPYTLPVLTKFEKGKTYVIVISYSGGVSYNDPWVCTSISGGVITLKDRSGAVATGKIRQAGTQQVALVLGYQLYASALYTPEMVE